MMLTRLHRMTSIEREEKEKLKKRERKLEEEETMQQATWVKYTFPIKHQVHRHTDTYTYIYPVGRKPPTTSNITWPPAACRESTRPEIGCHNRSSGLEDLSSFDGCPQPSC